MKKLLILSILILSIQSFAFASTNEEGFSQSLPGTYALVEAKYKGFDNVGPGYEGIYPFCTEEVELKIVDGNLYVNGGSALEFLNTCDNQVEEMSQCIKSTQLSHEDITYNNRNKIYQSKLELDKDDSNKLTINVTQLTNGLFFMKKIKKLCTYKRI